MIPLQRDLHPVVRQCLFETGHQVIGRRGHMRAGCLSTALTPYQANLYRFKGGGGGFKSIITAVVIGAALGAVTGGIGFALNGTFGLTFSAAASIGEAVATGAILGAIGGALSGAASMMMGKQATPEQDAYTQRENKVTVRNSTAPRKIILGTALAGGVMVYATSTGSSKEYFHSVNTVASHQVAALREVSFNNNPESQSRYSGKYRIKKHLGTQTQTADSDLVSESGGEWTNAHRGLGIAYLYNRIQHDSNAWVTGLPSVSVMADGALLYDPRKPHITISTSSVAAPGVFSTVGAHGLAVGDVVFLRDHLGATYRTPSGYAAPVTKAYTVNTVPTSTTFTLLNDSGEPMALLTSGSGGAVSKCAWSNNWALGLLHYLLARDGINCPTSRIDWTYFEAAADVSDEDVSLGNSTTFTASTSSNALTLAADVGWGTGVQVYVSSTGTLPAPLAADTAYYWIRHDNSDPGVGQLAASYADALAGTAIDITTAGSGTHTVFAAVSVTLSASADTVTLPSITTYIETGDCVTLTGAMAGTDYYWINTGYLTGKLATSRANAIAGTAIDIAADGSARLTRKNQARYTVNGILDLSKKPIDVLNDLLTAGSGVLSYSSGKYRLFAGAPASSVKTLGEDGLRDTLRILPRAGRQQTVNAVRGTYKEPGKYWEMTDFPPLTRATYEAEDGGQRLYRDVSLPLTIDPQRAQRIASIALGRGRRSMVVNYPGTVELLGISAWDAVQLALPTPGLASTKFRVQRWVLAENGQGIDLELVQEDDAIYDWTPGQGVVLPKNDLSSLPDPWDVSALSGLALSSGTADLFVRQDGTVFSRIRVSWDAPADAGVTDGGRIEIQAKRSADSDWGAGQFVGGDAAEHFLLDVEDGISYDVRVRAINTLGAKSAWTTAAGHVVVGKTAPPGNVTSFSAAQNGAAAVFRWSNPTDLDLAGATIRYGAPGTAWEAKTPLTSVTRGTQITTVALPPGEWEIGIKAVDTSGNESAAMATASLTMGNTNTVIASSPQAPDWLGTKTGCVKHWTGVLVPDSTLTAADMTDAELWDTFVASPVALCSYEVAAETVLSVNGTPRLWAAETGALGPGESAGAFTPQLEVDYRTLAGAYDGFEPWTIGTAACGAFKMRVSWAPADGVAYLSEFTPTADASAQTENHTVAVDLDGYDLTFDAPFFAVPVVQVTPVGGGAQIGVATSVTATGCTILLYTTAGAAATGSANVTITGPR